MIFAPEISWCSGVLFSPVDQIKRADVVKALDAIVMTAPVSANRALAHLKHLMNWCVDRGMKLVGIDYLSIEPQGPEKEGYPTHKTLLGAKVVIIEGLDLKDVPPGAYDLACGAIKFEGGDGAPARVFLIER